MSKPRDVVVVRVSEKGDREDEHFHSPEVQIEAAMRWAKDRGERLVASPIPEIDVSGRLPLSKRPGLLAAIEMIEAGQADQLVVAFFDRLVRSLKVQLEVIERVERAGGEIFALDHGKLTNGTAAQRLSTNMLGSVFQYFAEITGEKVTAAQARAVARGVYPHPKIPVGYVRGENGVLVVEPAAAKVVVLAFKRRDQGASLVEIQALLAENGIERSISGVASMLRSRMYLGDRGESNVIGPDDIDQLREPAKRLAAWRRLITDTVESVTVAPAMTADGRPSRLWNPRRINITFLSQHP